MAPPPVARIMPGRWVSSAMTAFSPAAETGFALQLENQRNAGPGSLFNFMVAIEKLTAQRLRQSSANSGFADPHRAD